MADGRFSCTAVTTFDLFAMRDWVKSETEAGRLPAGRPIRIEVRHPDREMDGSCRWCGCRDNEVIEFDS
jgi:hypothetical protein